MTQQYLLEQEENSGRLDTEYECCNENDDAYKMEINMYMSDDDDPECQPITKNFGLAAAETGS